MNRQEKLYTIAFVIFILGLVAVLVSLGVGLFIIAIAIAVALYGWLVT